MEGTESRQGGQDGDRREARFGDVPSRAELGYCVAACRAAELHRSDGEAESFLLIGVEPEVREVVVLRVNAVPELFLTCQRLDADRYPEHAKSSLVPFECLATGLLAVGIAHHARGDLPQGKWARGLEENQDQVCHPFEPIGSCCGRHLLHGRPRPPKELPLHLPLRGPTRDNSLCETLEGVHEVHSPR